MKQTDVYYSPAVKVILVENRTVLCSSPADRSMTEKFTVSSSNNYDEDDWE